MKDLKTIKVLLGPTSTGKTTRALKECKKTGGEIISADSRQMFKHMDIGTGKLPINSDISVIKGKNKWVLDGINVWGYDVAEPDQYFSVYEWAQFALKKAKELIDQEKEVMLVGGTGFFIDVFTGRTKLEGAPPDFELRNYLNQLEPDELKKNLMSLNSEAVEGIDLSNPIRIIRAIEHEMSQKENSPTPLPYLQNIKFEFTGLTAARDFLYEKADLWAQTVWENGLIKETIHLLELGYKDSKPLNSFIYKTVVEHLNKPNFFSEEEAIERIQFDLHAYIRRQQTYFKKMPNIKWINIQE